MGHAHNYIIARLFRAGRRLITVGSRPAAPAASTCVLMTPRPSDVGFPSILRDG